MADLTLNEYHDIPEDEVYRLLKIEVKKGFSGVTPEKNLKNSIKITYSNAEFPNDRGIGIFPIVRYFKELLRPGIS